MLAYALAGYIMLSDGTLVPIVISWLPRASNPTAKPRESWYQLSKVLFDWRQDLLEDGVVTSVPEFSVDSAFGHVDTMLRIKHDHGAISNMYDSPPLPPTPPPPSPLLTFPQ